MVVNRFEVYLVNLDPTVGVEIRKTRPCLVVSPDEMNHHVRTAIIAPMTTKGRSYPTRVACRFKRKNGQVVLDQIRAVDQGHRELLSEKPGLARMAKHVEWPRRSSGELGDNRIIPANCPDNRVG